MSVSIRLDSRLLAAGLVVSVALSARVYVEHMQASDDAGCRLCGHWFTDADLVVSTVRLRPNVVKALCPSAALTRGLLNRRGFEDTAALAWVAEQLPDFRDFAKRRTGRLGVDDAGLFDLDTLVGVSC